MKHSASFPLHNENGSVLVLTLMLLVILTILGMAATQTTIFELQITGNERQYRQVFNGAETGLAATVPDSESLGDNNITVDTFTRLTFNGAETIRETVDRDDGSVVASVIEPGNGLRDTRVDVLYQSSDAGASLRGSGYSAGKFKAHNYEVRSLATNPGGAGSEVRAQGYRVGF